MHFLVALLCEFKRKFEFSGGGWGCLIIMYLYVCVH